MTKLNKLEQGQWWNKMWSVTTGCTPVSAGCQHCYANAFLKRFPAIHGPGDGPVHMHPERLDVPLKRKKPTVYFVSGMSDLLHEDVETVFLAHVADVMRRADWHTFIFLSKRPERWQEQQAEGTWRLADAFNLPNVWLGVTAENQAMADERIPLLLGTSAAHRFVSYEPALGPVDLTNIRTGPDQPMHGHPKVIWHPCGNALQKPKPTTPGYVSIVPPRWSGLDAVICGGESGPGARPMHPDWARNVRDQCAEAGVPFFFKQWGAWRPRGPADGDTRAPSNFVCSACGGRGEITNALINLHREHCDRGNVVAMIRVGKKAAGRVLDGQTHDNLPWLEAD